MIGFLLLFFRAHMPAKLAALAETSFEKRIKDFGNLLESEVEPISLEKDEMFTKGESLLTLESFNL
jgi:hypothetical protein